MKKLTFLLILLISGVVFAQWNGTSNKVIRERDLFDSIFQQALDSANVTSGGAVDLKYYSEDSTISKIVLNPDSVGIRGNLDVDGDVNLGSATDYINMIKGTSLDYYLDNISRLRFSDEGIGTYIYRFGTTTNGITIEDGPNPDINIVSQDVVIHNFRLSRYKR